MQRLIARPSDRLQPSVTSTTRDLSARPKPRWRWAKRFLYRRYVFILFFLGVVLISKPYVGAEHLQDVFDRIGQTVVFATVRVGFAVDNILVVGNRNVAQQALLESLGISPGTPLLFVDLLAASARVEALDWVRAAELRRQLPDQLLLRVYERDPVALWQRGTTFTLVDDQGYPFMETAIRLFDHLPVLVGSAAPQAYSRLSATLPSLTEFRTRLAAAIWVGERRWNLKFASGLTIYLPETNVEAAWRLFVSQVKASDLLSRDLVTVDLRQSGRFIVGVHPEAVWEREETVIDGELKRKTVPQEVRPNRYSPSQLAVGEHDA